MLFLQLPAIQPDSTTQTIIEGTNERLNYLKDLAQAGEWDVLVSEVTQSILSFGKDLLIAIVIFLIGRWLIRRIVAFMERVFERRSVDVSLRTFLKSVVNITLYIILITIVIDQLGLGTTSFIALFGAAGLAIGMALSGTLQNFAGGVMILLIKPYRVGDYIEAQGQAGTVKDIQLFNTMINTPDNKIIYIPNGPISTGIVNNYSREDKRRVEWVIGINYGDDFDVARNAIKEILDKHPKILRDPAYTIEISALADSAVNIVIRVWVKTGDYWDVYFDINAQIYKTLPQKGILFPYPQLDVHITQ